MTSHRILLGAKIYNYYIRGLLYLFEVSLSRTLSPVPLISCLNTSLTCTTRSLVGTNTTHRTRTIERVIRAYNKHNKLVYSSPVRDQEIKLERQRIIDEIL